MPECSVMIVGLLPPGPRGSFPARYTQPAEESMSHETFIQKHRFLATLTTRTEHTPKFMLIRYYTRFTISHSSQNWMLMLFQQQTL